MEKLGGRDFNELDKKRNETQEVIYRTQKDIEILKQENTFTGIGRKYFENGGYLEGKWEDGRLKEGFFVDKDNNIVDTIKDGKRLRQVSNIFYDGSVVNAPGRISVIYRGDNRQVMFTQDIQIDGDFNVDNRIFLEEIIQYMKDNSIKRGDIQEIHQKIREIK